MRCRKVIWFFVAALLLWRQLATAEAAELTGREARARALFAPRPTYPYEARAKHEQGSGIAILTVDPATGNVTNVVMALSTGVKILDDATISAFSQWRFKPGTVKKVRLPITFSLSVAGGPAVAEVRVLKALPMEQLLARLLGKGNVVNAPIPVYPPHPLQTSKQGRGVYEIHVNNAGTVTEVKILKSSGDTTFDQVTVDTLRQWRLRHGPKIIEFAARVCPHARELPRLDSVAAMC
jgi:TonB family protein